MIKRYRTKSIREIWLYSMTASHITLFYYVLWTVRSRTKKKIYLYNICFLQKYISFPNVRNDPFFLFFFGASRVCCIEDLLFFFFVFIRSLIHFLLLKIINIKSRSSSSSYTGNLSLFLSIVSSGIGGSVDEVKPGIFIVLIQHRNVVYTSSPRINQNSSKLNHNYSLNMQR